MDWINEKAGLLSLQLGQEDELDRVGWTVDEESCNRSYTHFRSVCQGLILMWGRERSIGNGTKLKQT